jgi:hypothetical protein
VGAAVVAKTIVGVLKMMARNSRMLVAVQGGFGYVHHRSMDDRRALPAGV